MTVQQAEEKLARKPHSPLFAYLAERYLVEHRTVEAKKLLLAGIERYPQYVTAQVILAQCLATEKDFLGAIETLKKLPPPYAEMQSLQHLFHQWQRDAQERKDDSVAIPSEPKVVETSVEASSTAEVSIEKEEMVVEEMQQEQRNDVVEQAMHHNNSSNVNGGISKEEVEVEKVEPVTAPESSEVALSSLPEKKEDAEQLDAEQVTTASEAQPDSLTIDKEVEKESEHESLTMQNGQTVESPSSDVTRGRIVSKTLAEIYAQQGQYAEAIITYELLKTQKPNEAEEYDRRIRELETQLQTKEH